MSARIHSASTSKIDHRPQSGRSSKPPRRRVDDRSSARSAVVSADTAHPLVLLYDERRSSRSILEVCPTILVDKNDPHHPLTPLTVWPSNSQSGPFQTAAPPDPPGSSSDSTARSAELLQGSRISPTGLADGGLLQPRKSCTMDLDSRQSLPFRQSRPVSDERDRYRPTIPGITP